MPAELLPSWALRGGSRGARERQAADAGAVMQEISSEFKDAQSSVDGSLVGALEEDVKYLPGRPLLAQVGRQAAPHEVLV